MLRAIRDARGPAASALAILLLAIAPAPVRASEGAAAPVRETCASLRETKIQGPICKGFIQNDCAHGIDMTVRHVMTLRRVVVLPVMAEGPSMEYQDAGTVEKEQAHSLDAGEGAWYVQKNDGKGIEVASCKMSFSYTYEE